MNATCGTETTHEWKRGWALRSGGCADLCYNCGWVLVVVYFYCSTCIINFNFLAIFWALLNLLLIKGLSEVLIYVFRLFF